MGVAYQRLQAVPGAFRGDHAAGAGIGLLAGGAGAYIGFVLSFPAQLHVIFAPAVGIAVALAAFMAMRQGYQSVSANSDAAPVLAAAGVVAAGLGAWCGFLVSGEPGSKLYLSWAVSCLLAGVVALAL